MSRWKGRYRVTERNNGSFVVEQARYSNVGRCWDYIEPHASKDVAFASADRYYAEWLAKQTKRTWR